MSVQIEKLEHNMAKLTIEVGMEQFEKAVAKAYLKMKGRIQVPGFRKGKAPRKMIEKLYGPEIFFEEAANIAIPDAYSEALKEIKEKVVSRPQIDVTQIEAGKPFIFTADVALKPEVTLGQYKGIEVEGETVYVTEEEIDAEVNRERETNARMVDVDDRPVEKGDVIRLDYEGTISGEPFEGGTAKDQQLVIGSGSFIPGFEDQLIGTKLGEDKDVVVTFPDDYHAEDLQGKVAVFACKVNSIQKKELPELDDEFAQDVSEFDTLEEYRDNIRKTISERKEADARRKKETAVVDKIIAEARMDIPQAMVEEQVSRMAEDFSYRLRAQGLSLEQYMQFTGMDAAKLREQWGAEALKRIQNSLVLEAVADAEELTVSDERLDEEITKMAESYRMDADKLKETMGEEELDQIRADLRIQEAVDLVREAAKEV